MNIRLNWLLLILIIIIAVLLVIAASGLLVLAAAGIGWGLTHWLRLPFTLYETSLLGLIALLAVIWAVMRLIITMASMPVPARSVEEEDEGDWDEDEEDWEEDEEEIKSVPIPSIPKWRQPLRRASDGLPIVGPNEKCPCGSGRKYKNCHGRKS